jgi:hypothetical protein
MYVSATVWKDVIAPVIIAITGGAVAALWPWIQTYWRGRKFEGLIERELRELAPVPLAPQRNTPWWKHLQTRFVHEEIFALSQVSVNRDFLLSLDPTVLYQVSQLWISFGRRDAQQFLHFLDRLGDSERVGSRDLKNAARAWRVVIGDAASNTQPPAMRSESTGRAEALLGARLSAYASLLPLTEYGTPERPRVLSPDQRKSLDTKLEEWFYDRGGLLLSSPSLASFRLARHRLTDDQASHEHRRHAFSALRTELKIELGTVPEDERRIEMASIE